MNTDWGYSREEVLGAEKIIRSIMNQEIANAVEGLEMIFDNTNFKEKNDETVIRLSQVLSISSIISKASIVELFLDHIKKGSF